MKKRDMYAAGISENSRQSAKPLDKEKKQPEPDDEEEHIPTGKIRNEYTSPSTKGKTRVLRF